VRTTTYSCPVPLALALTLLLAAHSARAETAADAPTNPAEQAPATAPSGLTLPELRRFVPADYPPGALAAKLESSVLLELVIDAKGRVTEARVLEPRGHGFDEAAVQAARQFEFVPARRDDIPIAVTIHYEYQFTLPPAEAAPDQTAEPAAVASTPKAPSGPAAPSTPASAATTVPPASDAESQAAPLEFGAEATVEAPPREVTRHTLEAGELTHVAGTNGDALRAVEVLPGVSRPPSGDATPLLRGVSSWESTVLLDGVPIPLLYHFNSLVSTFNSRLLERVDLYPGNFSVRYGRVYGGVIEARARDPKTDRLHALLDLSLWDSSALVETPVGSKSGMAIAARRSNVDVYFDAIAPEGAYSVVSAPVYWDYQAIAAGQLGARHHWRVMGYGSRDSMGLFFSEPVESDPFIRGKLYGRLEFHQAHASLESQLGHGVEQELSLALSRNILQQQIGPVVDAKFVGLGLNGRAEWRVPASDALSLAFGLDTQASRFHGWYHGSQAPQLEGNPNLAQPNGTEEQVDIAGTSKYEVKPAAYVELGYRPTRSWLLVPGVRVDYFSALREWSADPRLSIRYQLLPDTALKAGVGLFSQEPIYYQYYEKIGNPDVGLAHALHLSVGAEQKFGKAAQIGAEVFHKRLWNRVVATEGGVPPRFINDGSGRIYGLELSSVVRPSPGTFGYLAYTLSRSERRDRNEPWRLFDYDQTHNLIVAATHQLGRGWEVGARFRLVSGNPSTPVVNAVYDARTAVYQPVFGAVNSEREPVFHQLDLLGQKTWKFRDWSLSVYLDLQNAYNASVPEGTEYSYDYSDSRATSGTPFFPNFGVRGEL
jgi:TonB family protein